MQWLGSRHAPASSEDDNPRRSPSPVVFILPSRQRNAIIDSSGMFTCWLETLAADLRGHIESFEPQERHSYPPSIHPSMISSAQGTLPVPSSSSAIGTNPSLDTSTLSVHASHGTQETQNPEEVDITEWVDTALAGGNVV